jgi:extradiol dioxygenase family protein
MVTLPTMDARFHLSFCAFDRAWSARDRWKMVVADPGGNDVELKCYRDERQIFRTM